uniref:Uncharacterized protein n=1 Tax=Arundo donax TaxID=35708 RepID=A0A0A9AVZ2_ARUDO
MARSAICCRALNTIVRWYSMNTAGVKTSTSSSDNNASISWNQAHIGPVFMTRLSIEA